MKAAIYYGQKDVRIETLETPIAGDNDVVIRNLYASICRTDVAAYLNGLNAAHRITVGSEFGHAMISEVVQVGRNVKDIAVGDIVYPYPQFAKGDPMREDTIGGFSEYVLVSNAEHDKQLYDIPVQIPPKTACLLEPFTVGFHAARRAAPKQGENAIVFGADTIGIAAAIGLKHFGCKQVMVCDHSDFRLGKAKGIGFAICNNSRENLKEAAMKCFGTAPSHFDQTANVSIYIDAAGTEPVLKQYQAMGQLESRMVVIAVPNGTRLMDVQAMTYSQHALIGSSGYMPEDVEDVIAVMVSRKWDIASIVTDVFRLEQLPQALDRAAEVEHTLNVIIKY